MTGLNLEQRFGNSESLLAAVEYFQHLPEFASIEAKSAAEAYASAFKYAGKGIKRFATPLVRIAYDVALLVPDAVRYVTNGKTLEQKEIQAKKVVSRSVALGELVAMVYGARFATSAIGELSTTLSTQYNQYLGNAMQAVTGSFIGSEGTTAGVLFVAYGGLTLLGKVRHARNFGDLDVKSTFADSMNVVGESIKQGIFSFACADIPVSILFSLFLPPEAAATAGAVAGMIFYTRMVKSSLDSSIEKGYLCK